MKYTNKMLGEIIFINFCAMVAVVIINIIF